ncbi:MAG: uncharacterized protein JWM74_4383 [Myxococcaceae bacterium]|nr:uncharacterized protein [Myxococcaceae bacterium]
MRLHHLILGAMAIGLTTMGTVAACARSEPEPGALMLAVQTDMRAPDDVDAIGIYVVVNGVPIFAVEAEVLPNGIVKLPATLAIVGKKNPGATAKIRVVGFQKGRARIVRDASASIPLNRTALLRLPLRWVNDGQAVGEIPINKPIDFDPLEAIHSTCPALLTPIDGECQSADVDSSTLPDYSEPDVFGGGSADGTGGTCFDVAACFDKSTDVTNLALDTCSFPAPAAASFSVGVRAKPGAGGTCASLGCYVPLDAEADDGWKREGNTIKLSRGVCKAITAGRALGISVSTCAPKPVSQPICGPASAVSGGGPAIPLKDGGAAASPPVDVGRTPTPVALVDVVLTDTDVFALANDGKVYRTAKTLATPLAPMTMVFDTRIFFLGDGAVLTGDYRFAVSRDGIIAVTQRESNMIVLGNGKLAGAGGPINAYVTSLSAQSKPFRIMALALDDSTSEGALVWTEIPTLGDTAPSTIYSCVLGSSCSVSRTTRYVQPFAASAPHPIELGYAPFTQTAFAAFDNGAVKELFDGGTTFANISGTFPIASPAIDQTALYWMTASDASVTDTIYQAGLGSGGAAELVTGQSFRAPNVRQDLALDTLYKDSGSSFTGNPYIFWTNTLGEVRARRTVVSGNAEILIATEPGTRGLAIDKTHVYWSRADGVVRRFARADIPGVK